MAQPTTIEEAIDRNARGPASVTIGDQTVTAKDVSQQIQADKYLKSLTAARAASPGFRLGKVIPGGCG